MQTIVNTYRKIQEFLKQPYPFYFEGKTLYVLLGILFLMGVAFEYSFKPFSVHFPEHRFAHIWIVIIHTLVACTALVLCAYLLRALPGMPGEWTVGKDLLFLASFLLLTGIGQFLVRDLIYDNPNNWSLGYLLEEVRNTFLIGTLFILILVPLNHNRLLIRNQKRAAGVHPRRGSKAEGTAIHIQTALKGEDLVIHPETFQYAKAEGNYVTVCQGLGNEMQKALIRLSISELERQLAAYPYIFRTHRSYLVNLNQVCSIRGNAQGYRLQLHGIPGEPVAVSRKQIPGFEARMAQD